METVLLYLLAPIIAFMYKILDYYGFWAWITNRNHALEGIRRLKSGKGYPDSWIYNDDKDKKEFNALYRRIKRNTKNAQIKAILKEGHVPSLISIAGEPIVIKGLEPKCPLEHKISYIGNHPIMLIFNVDRSGGKGKGGRCCSLEELEGWINNEKRLWDFWAGVVVLSVLSIIFAYLQIIHDL